LSKVSRQYLTEIIAKTLWETSEVETPDDEKCTFTEAIEFDKILYTLSFNTFSKLDGHLITAVVFQQANDIVDMLHNEKIITLKSN
jgi:hypothetical protein